MNFFYVIFSVLFFSLIAQAQGRVLITSFEAYGGLKKNSTVAISKTIQKKLAERNIQVQLCNLPVTYDQAATIAKTCYEQMNPKPDLVISLGQGCSTMVIETLAHNIDNDSAMKDNAGVLRVNHQIIPGGASPISLSGSLMDMYCAVASEKDRKEIGISQAAGFFVCNNTAYLLGNYFGQNRVRYGFIHVPVNTCVTNGKNIEKKAANQLVEMIAALPLFNPANYTSSSFETLVPYTPKTSQQIQQSKNLIMERMGDPSRRDCGIEFMSRLDERIN